MVMTSCLQVLKLKVDLLATLGQKGTFTRTSASFCLNELVDKVGDIKNGAAVQEALSCIAEAISLNYIGTEVCHILANALTLLIACLLKY